MRFTNQQPFVVTPEHHKNATSHGRRFGCVFCDKKFAPGDTARWVYANGTAGFNAGNFYVCPEHNTPDVLERAKESYATAKKLAKQWGIYGPDWQQD